MKVSEARLGRVFVLRLETGDRLPDAVEAFAREHGVEQGVCLLVGGVQKGRLVTGPEDGEARPVVPMVAHLSGVHEIAAVGTLFPDETGSPKLHMHAAVGRGEHSLTGCVRMGVDMWELGELVLLELVDSGARRQIDPATGFQVLEVGKRENG